MLRYGIDYYAAAIATDEILGNEEGHEIIAPTTVNFLMGHAIELGLKAFLLQRGVPLEKVVKSFRHDLAALMKASVKQGLADFVAIQPDDRGIIQTLNGLYATKQLEYIETGLKSFPVFGPLQLLAKRLLTGVATAVPGAERLLERKGGEILQR